MLIKEVTEVSRFFDEALEIVNTYGAVCELIEALKRKHRVLVAHEALYAPEIKRQAEFLESLLPAIKATVPEANI